MGSLDLAAILDPLSVDEFLVDYFGQRPLHSPGALDRFQPLTNEAAVRELAWRLEQVLESPVRGDRQTQLNLIATPADVFLLQVDGENTVRVAPPAGGEGGREGELRSGGALYLPRGWTCAGVTAPVLVMSIDNPRGVDLLRWLLTMLEQNEVAQRDVPRFGGPATMAAYAKELRQLTAHFLRAPGLLEHYCRYRNQMAPGMPHLGAPWSPGTPPEHLIVITAARPIEILYFAPHTIGFVFDGRRYEFPEDVAMLLHFLLDRNPVPVDAFFRFFENDFERAHLVEFLQTLSTARVITTREPEAS